MIHILLYIVGLYLFLTGILTAVLLFVNVTFNQSLYILGQNPLSFWWDIIVLFLKPSTWVKMIEDSKEKK